MKLKLGLFIMMAVCSAPGMGAFSETENRQLEAINRQSASELASARVSLDDAIAKQVQNNPEQKGALTALRDAWGNMIDKKCQLETIESVGTDAQVVEVNNCLTRNYKEETAWFGSMLP